MLGSVRWSVANLLIFVAATAPGLALARSLPNFVLLDSPITMVEQVRPNGSSGVMVVRNLANAPAGRRPFEISPSYWFIHLAYWSAPCLACWSVAALILNLGGPERPLRRFERPGVAIGLGVMLAATIALVECARCMTATLTQWGNLRHSWPAYYCYFWNLVPRAAGLVIVVAWLARITVSHRGQPRGERGRVALLLGVAWVTSALVAAIGSWLLALNW